MSRKSALILSLALLATATLPSLAQDSSEHLVVYSGRSEGLIAPLLEQFVTETGITVDVRYGSTAEMAATILEEGENSPADLFIAQDAGALGALAAAGRLLPLPSDILERVPAAYRSPQNLWIGLSGRARVLAYNTTLVNEATLPASILDLASEAWAGRVGWAPTNGSFQAHITALRVLLGDDATRNWLAAMQANRTVAYDNNRAVLQAVIDGEIAAGLINHYYLYPFLDVNPALPVRLYYFPEGDAGSLINVAGVGIVNTTHQPGLSQRLILYLLGRSAQQYFATATYEYPLVDGVDPDPRLTPLNLIAAPVIDLSDLADLQTTLDMLAETGVLP
ncbi:MAG: iron ABC transporter substrate-binding protein [Anaerolineae bacterium]|nr:iron ABC transporter substrate-binding protein [Anaerolineae bacterium]